MEKKTMMLDKHKINGEKVAMLRARKGWSQRQLGELVGLSQAGVNVVEKEYTAPSGEYRSTSVEKFIRLAEVLNVSLDYLADLTDDPRSVAELLNTIQKLKDNLGTGIAVVPDTPAQGERLRTLLEGAKQLTEPELNMMCLLIKRLGETPSRWHPETTEAEQAARIVDHLSKEEREKAVVALRQMEDHTIVQMQDRMDYLIGLVNSLGIDAATEIERRFGVAVDARE
jgi:transcriptional regulator with XRE-family HTH domain